jgi:hypothetical protein
LELPLQRTVIWYSEANRLLMIWPQLLPSTSSRFIFTVLLNTVTCCVRPCSFVHWYLIFWRNISSSSPQFLCCAFIFLHFPLKYHEGDCLCGLVVRVPGYRSRSPGSIPSATRFSEKWLAWNGVLSASWVQLKSYLEEIVVVPV